ncbi:DUF3114 domain-containing protein [Enterococcus faecalis]
MISWNDLRQAIELLVMEAIRAGWDRRAVQRLVTVIFKELQPLSFSEALTVVQQAASKLHLVGSSLYQQLFCHSSYHPQQKLSLLLDQLDGELDQYGMLQLRGDHQFDPALAPHARFWHVLAKTVQRAYPQGLLAASNQTKAKQVHQLRMYIDRQNIQYIRTYFKQSNMTDEAALRQYVFTAVPKGLGGKKLKREPARLHNKYLKGTPYLNQALNKKRLSPHFHSEFILNPHGQFVSQWDVLVERWNGTIISDPAYYQRIQMKDYESKLLNGESFNYADRNNRKHDLLDGTPPGRFDHELRQQAKRKWRSPQPSEYDYRQDREPTIDDYSK